MQTKIDNSIPQNPEKISGYFFCQKGQPGCFNLFDTKSFESL